jgi:hypothetical protein
MNRIELLHGKYAHLAIAMMAALALTGSVYAQQTHKAKSGRLEITAPTQVAGITLEPGTYEVKEIKGANGAELEFIHEFRNELASELVQAEQEEVVARVKVGEQALHTRAAATQLLPSSCVASSLEIRGDSVAYILNPTQMAGQ